MSDQNFYTIIEQTLGHEGGLVDHPADPGGITNWGISYRFAKSNEKTIGVVLGKQVSVTHDFIRTLTREDAVKIYKKYFWDDNKYNKIKDLNVASQVFDMSVNAGARVAQRLLQQALHACGKFVAIDSYAGNETYAAMEEVPANCLLAAYKSERAGYYREITAKRPANKSFIKGWLRRAYGSRYNYS